MSSPNTSSYETVGNDFDGDLNLQTPIQEPIGDDFHIEQESSSLSSQQKNSVIVTNASIDVVNLCESPVPKENGTIGGLEAHTEEPTAAGGQTLGPSEPKSNCVSPASSNGGIYSVIF